MYLLAFLGIQIFLIALEAWVEGAVMTRMGWAGSVRSRVDAAYVNAISAVLGVFLSGPGSNKALPLAQWLAGMWILSVLVEGGLLVALRRREVVRTLRMAAIANAASYGALIGFAGWFVLVQRLLAST